MSERDERSFDPMLPALKPTGAVLASAQAQGILFEPGDLDRLGRHLAFLRDANQRFNLTAVDEPEAMWTRHVLDSLALLPVIEALREDHGGGPLRIIDVGSGGGFPGMPLAIALSGRAMTLLEATGKKARFLRDVVEALELEGVTVVQARAEEAGRDRERHREGYDAVVSRAVGPLPTLLELTVPFARVGGLVLAIKGERAAAEIADSKGALHALHARALDPIRTPTSTIVVVEKLRATPKLYPRRAGEPKRVPLGSRLRRERDID
jgi:16S rRNA (guanine527-N7)-methyltransferase